MSLKSLMINYYFMEPHNQTFSIPSSLHPSDPSTDSLSLTLHNLSRISTLETLHIGGISNTPMCISPSLFWLQDGEGVNERGRPTPPFWPSLRNVYIGASGTTPSGSWHHIRDIDGEDWVLESPDVDLDEDIETTNPSPQPASPVSENSETYRPDTFHGYHIDVSMGNHPVRYFRTKLDPDSFNPLMLAISKAICQMPSLRRFELEMGDIGYEGIEWYFLEKGQVGYNLTAGRAADETLVRMNIGKAAKWRPTDEMISLWEKKAGKVVIDECI